MLQNMKGARCGHHSAPTTMPPALKALWLFLVMGLFRRAGFVFNKLVLACQDRLSGLHQNKASPLRRHRHAGGRHLQRAVAVRPVVTGGGTEAHSAADGG